MPSFRGCLAALLCASLIAAPSWSAPVNALGTIVAADRAHLSDTAASPGATVFSGDRVNTEAGGSLQLRTSGSRVFFAASSSAALTESAGTPQLTLLSGTTVFSTATSKGLELLFNDVHLRPLADGPTIAQVRIAGPKELLVTTRRGALLFSLEGDSEVLPEGNTFRVTLDPPEAAAAQGPRGVGAPGYGKTARKAGRNRFAILVITAGIVVPTILALHEAWESPDKP